MPRLWFLSEDDSELVQIQDNWLARNWRKQKAAKTYPRFPALRAKFMKDLSALRAFLRRQGLPHISPQQCEVTYINHVDVEDLPSPSLGSVLRLVDDRPVDYEVPSESLRLAAAYPIVHEGSKVGRLHLSADPAIRRSDGRNIIVLTFTARGTPLGKGIPGVGKFLDLGRESAMRAFVGLTRKEMHQIWRRIDGR
jgi:uncharacterized protein (TIGR04255 family)